MTHEGRRKKAARSLPRTLRRSALRRIISGTWRRRTLSRAWPITASYVETLESEMKRSDRTGRSFAVLAFDLDGMKRINDSHGHLAGNRRHLGAVWR